MKNLNLVIGTRDLVWENSDTFPMLLNMIVQNNENYVYRKDLFTSEFFKQELLSL